MSEKRTLRPNGIWYLLGSILKERILCVKKWKGPMISQFGWNVPVIRGLERDGEDARQMWKDNITGWFMKIAMLTHKGLRKERILC